jgi:hypothetical protein
MLTIKVNQSLINSKPNRKTAKKKNTPQSVKSRAPKKAASKVTSSKKAPKKAPKKPTLRLGQRSPDRSPNVAFFQSRKNYYARYGALVVVLKSDGYFRRKENLPTRVLHPRGPAKVDVEDKNELRRGLFLAPVHT